MGYIVYCVKLAVLLLLSFLIAAMQFLFTIYQVQQNKVAP